MRLARCRAWSSTRRAFNLKGGDSWVESCNGGSLYENLYLDGGRFTVTNFYAGGTCEGLGLGEYPASQGGIVLNTNDRSILVGVQTDYCHKDQIVVKDANNVVISASKVVYKNVESEWNNTYTAIKLVNSQECVVEANIVSRYDDEVTSNLKYGIEETGTSDNNIILGNYVEPELVSDATIKVIGANTEVKHNKGYVTENSGTATVANGDWIPHDLADTPKIVTLTPRSQVTVWVNDRNETHFQIGVSSGTVTVDWHAEV
jgi:hypothetical protein